LLIGRDNKAPLFITINDDEDRFIGVAQPTKHTIFRPPLPSLLKSSQIAS